MSTPKPCFQTGNVSPFSKSTFFNTLCEYIEFYDLLIKNILADFPWCTYTESLCQWWWRPLGAPAGSSWRSLDPNYENKWNSTCCSCSAALTPHISSFFTADNKTELDALVQFSCEPLIEVKFTALHPNEFINNQSVFLSLQVTAKFAIMFITVQYNVTQVLGEPILFCLLLHPFTVLRPVLQSEFNIPRIHFCYLG